MNLHFSFKLQTFIHAFTKLKLIKVLFNSFTIAKDLIQNSSSCNCETSIYIHKQNKFYSNDPISDNENYKQYK